MSYWHVQTKARGFLATGALIVKRETPLALYKGLGAVLSGIVPKMAIRFASFETYKGWLADKETGKTSVGSIFIGAPHDRFEASCGIELLNSQLVLGLESQKPWLLLRRWKL